MSSGRLEPDRAETVELTIDGFAHGGDGVGRLPDGKAIFVPGTIPGERVVVRVASQRRRWARGEVVAVTDASPDRVSPPCPYVPACGGCDLQHVTPSRQRDLKRRVLVEQLERIGGITDPPVRATVAVGEDQGYRTNARLHADERGRLGYHRAGTRDVVPVDRCLVLTPGAQRLREAVGDDTGAVEVVLRAPEHGDRAAVVLRPGPGPLRLPGGEMDLLLEQPDGSTVAMRGDGVLTERVGDIDYGYDATCFFQVNTGGAEALLAAVRDAAAPVRGALVWDLYAGVGLFAVALAVDGAEVTAVENHPASVRHLRDNLARAGVDANVLEAPVDRALTGDDGPLRRDAARGDEPDVVVLDPPRSGAGLAVTTAVAATRPARVVYVACDPASLARDARALVDDGFRLVHVTPYDLFPMTHHVEAVAVFDA